MSYRTRPASASTRTSNSFQTTTTRPFTSMTTNASTLQRTRPASATRTRTMTQQQLQHQSTIPQTHSAASLMARRRRAEQAEAREGNLIANQMQQAMNMSKQEKEHLIESLAAEQNGYLLMLLEKEQLNERERQKIMASVDEVGDQRRLEKIFAIERAKASAVIKNVTREQERALALKLHEFGVISDDEDDDDLMYDAPPPPQRR